MATRARALLWVGTTAGLLASACGGQASSPSPSPSPLTSPSSMSVGQWHGTTAQGMVIAFTVSADEMLTTLTVGHRFNGCAEVQTFANLQIATAPEVYCIPGPCTGTTATYRHIAFLGGSRGTGPTTTVFGVFLPGGQAQGVAHFSDFPGCGTASGVEWAATRR